MTENASQYYEQVQLGKSSQGFEEECGDKAFFEYLGISYQSFLAGDDEHYRTLENELAQRIGTFMTIYASVDELFV